MGQDTSKDCAGRCRGLCAPEDPSNEQRSEIENTKQRPVARESAGSSSRLGAAPEFFETSPSDDQVEAHVQPKRFQPGGWNDDEPDTCFVPAPFPDEPEASGDAEAPSPAPSPAPRPPAATSSARAAAPATSGGPGVSMDFELICADCLTAEGSVFGAAFDTLAKGQTNLQPDNTQLRDFVVQNSAVTLDDLDMELLKICETSDAFSIDKEGFVALLRQNAIQDGEALGLFMGLTSNGENISSEDCRSGLLNMMVTKMGSKLSQARLELIIDTVMVDAALVVGMEQWLAFCKSAARIVRVARYAKAS